MDVRRERLIIVAAWGLVVLATAGVSACRERAAEPMGELPRGVTGDPVETPTEAVPPSETVEEGSAPLAGRRSPPFMMDDGAAMDPNTVRDVRIIQVLLQSHRRIQRRVEDLPQGVRAVTTTDDEDLVPLLRTHAAEMARRVREGRVLRRQDPVFQEIFRRREQIVTVVRSVPGGVAVEQTSAEPEAVALVRQRARQAHSAFVEQGMTRAVEPTPLPQAYEARDGGGP